MTQKGSITYIDGKRVILDEDGKPCRSCNSLLDFQAAMGGGGGGFPGGAKKSSFNTAAAAAVGTGAVASSSVPTTSSGFKKECPPDVEALGRATWTFLHSMAAQYPKQASETEQTEMKSFLGIFSKVYPCWFCAEDFQAWMKKNEPKVGGRDEFGDWLCQAHNEVNQKLGKSIFDCKEWKARWRDAWGDGRC